MARDLVRLITCGSVDDGKSTLIGRLLHDAGAVPEDQLAALRTPSGEVDVSRLFDGLDAEREQGITIDVAYRHFETAGRRFILADTPGHPQYTRNMVTAASTADVAVVLVDARKGLLPQTRRHSYLVGLMGVRRVLLAVNKMDLMDWSRAAFDEIAADYRALAAELGLTEVTAVPVSGLGGDNVVRRSPNLPWYDGPTLLEWLETTDLAEATPGPFRMPVQWVNRPDADFRGYAGRIAGGTVRPGDAVRVLPSGRTTTIDRIVAMGGDLTEATTGQSVTLTLADHLDVSRGDVLAAADAPPEVADQFEIQLVWMADAPLLPGRAYVVKLGAATVTGQVTDIRHRVNVETLEPLAARTLELNDIAVCHLHLDAPLTFEPYAVSRDLGGLILIDRQTNETVGAGLIRYALRRSANVQWQALDVGRAERAALKHQKPLVLWFTGLSGAGKSTIANLVDKRLFADGRHTFLLDGDNVRHGLNQDLGFTDADRVENIRRITEVARLMADAGLIVLVSAISPFAAERRMARERMAPGEFVEIFVDAPLAVVEGRDVKGLYRKARAGELTNFTGIDSPYERPDNPDIRIDAAALTPEQACERIIEAIRIRL
ncbi:MAG: adenylyl-sulfate kinase [Brevundimonas sp.]|uniref:adenylyl-sulfate kinase n=1 Tax=Brevundimonas sp. TaxID=1871086 RepID=UPI0026186E6F|nr:adenylyl-sulfate kinase [Brevundimonas sp.]MDI6623134.1 adenylyl-sulfate kinase [Brevundimonas sp.]MDQ7811116.1 adenylyl-sulfate kinase [Brevundimonas sp.]